MMNVKIESQLAKDGDEMEIIQSCHKRSKTYDRVIIIKYHTTYHRRDAAVSSGCTFNVAIQKLRLTLKQYENTKLMFHVPTLGMFFKFCGSFELFFLISLTFTS